jgi:hypothetical protein
MFKKLICKIKGHRYKYNFAWRPSKKRIKDVVQNEKIQNITALI